MPRVKLGDVAREYKAVSKDSSNLPIVGLEHLTPGDITLDQWDEGVETTFTKAFKKGQMLFGRRRAYLKKAALAPFNGICSGDIIVIEAIPEKSIPPFFRLSFRMIFCLILLWVILPGPFLPASSGRV